MHASTPKERTLEYRNLGRTGVKVSQLCLGGMMFGGRTGEEDWEDHRRAIDAGIDFLDTANVYRWARSEEVVGKALKERQSPSHRARDQSAHGKDDHDPNPSGNHRGRSSSNVKRHSDASGKTT